MTQVLDAVLPVFLLAALGFFLSRIGFITEPISRGLNQLVYWIGLPCLLFHKISHQELDWNSVGKVMAAFFASLVCTIVLAYVSSLILKIQKESIGAYVQSAFRGNLGFIGLAIILYSVSEATLERSESIAAVALAPFAIAFNVIAVILMVVHQPQSDSPKPNLFYSMVTNPLIIGGVLGVSAAMFHWQIPLFADRSLAALSDMSIPLALLGLGSSFGSFNLQGIDRSFVTAAASSSLLKVLISPAIGVLFGLWFQLDPIEARIVVIYLATPTAIASHVIVGQFKGDEKLAATSIVTATLLSIFFLPLGLWITHEETWNWLLNKL